jgi:acetyl esterase/lipase
MFVPAVGNGIGVVLVHGSGGARQNSRPWCDTLASYGYVAMSIEYRDPDVNPGAVYPKKTRAAKLAVEFLRRNAARFGITTGKIAGWGMSNGAHTWGEAIIWDNDDAYFQTDSTVDDHVNAAVLLYGYYEESFTSPYWQAYFSNDTSRYIKGVCINHIGNISTPVLMLHGTADGIVPYQASVKMHDSLVALGKISQLLLFEGQPHVFDLNFPAANAFTPAGLVAKDTALAFLRRTVAPALKIRFNSSAINFGNVASSITDTTTIRIENIGSSSLRLESVAHSRNEYALIGGSVVAGLHRSTYVDID